MAETVDEFFTARPITGARVVATSFVMAVFAWGLGFYGLSVYSQFLGVEGRWSLGLMSAATTVYFVAGSVCIGLADRLAVRIGRRRVGLLGIVMLAGGAMLLPQVGHVALLILLYLAMAFGWAATSGTAITQIVGLWFHERRGLAASLALTGASVAGFTVVPFMVWQIGLWGVGIGIAVTAAVCGVLAFVSQWGMVDAPDSASVVGISSAQLTPVSAVAVASARLDRHLLGVVAIFTVGLVAQVAFLAHQLPILTPRIGAEQAALAVAFTTAAAMVGRLLLGLVIDRFDHRILVALCYGSQVIGLFILLTTDSFTGVVFACILFGVSVGNLITLPALFVQREFPPEQFGPVVSRIWSISQFFYAFGPLGAGLLIELTHSADAVIVICIMLQLFALGLCLVRRFTSADQ